MTNPKSLEWVLRFLQAKAKDATHSKHPPIPPSPLTLPLVLNWATFWIQPHIYIHSNVTSSIIRFTTKHHTKYSKSIPEKKAKKWIKGKKTNSTLLASATGSSIPSGRDLRKHPWNLRSSVVYFPAVWHSVAGFPTPSSNTLRPRPWSPWFWVLRPRTDVHPKVIKPASSQNKPVLF